MFRALFRQFLMGRGYTRLQTTRILRDLDWSRVREIIRQYGPTLLKIFLALLPLILEKPKRTASAKPRDEEEDYNVSCEIENLDTEIALDNQQMARGDIKPNNAGEYDKGS